MWQTVEVDGDDRRRVTRTTVDLETLRSAVALAEVAGVAEEDLAFFREQLKKKEREDLGDEKKEEDEEMEEVKEKDQRVEEKEEERV